MLIGGLEKFSLIDYPEHLSAIVFTKGCNFRCHFCYNPMLVWPESQDGLNQISSIQKEETKGRSLESAFNRQIQENDFFSFLENRIDKLDAVVITGGEPTIHSDLPDFIKKIKNLGFKVKLDTNGSNPKMLKDLIDNELINYIAMDIKGDIEQYDVVIGSQTDLNAIKESIVLIKKSGLPYEFRSTLVPGLHDEQTIKKMGNMISGAKKWYLQNFISDTFLVNENFKNSTVFKEEDLEKFKNIGNQYVDMCDIR